MPPATQLGFTYGVRRKEVGYYLIVSAPRLLHEQATYDRHVSVSLQNQLLDSQLEGEEP